MMSAESPQKENLSSKFNDLNNEVKTLRTTIKNRDKMRAIEWAIDNVDKFGCFEYKHKKVNTTNTYQSPEYVQSVLVWFRKGQGTFLDNNIYISPNTYCHMEQPKEDEREEFRFRLSEQIFQLTGTKPRIMKKDDGRYAIHYS